MDVVRLNSAGLRRWSSVVGWMLLSATCAAQSPQTRPQQPGRVPTPNKSQPQARPQAPAKGQPQTKGQQPAAPQPIPKPPAAPTAAVQDTGEAEWIWTSALNKDKTAPGTVYFRKLFTVEAIDTARIQIACDDRYDLFVNGRKVGSGNNWKVMDSYDVAKYLINGRNVVCVKAMNTSGSTAGVVARVTVRSRGATEVSYSTDASWRTSAEEVAGWERANFNDAQWVAARSFGELGAQPWGDEVRTADGSPVRRFAAKRDFRVERVLHPSITGSSIAMAFNEWGEILVAREGGPLLLVIDKNKDGIPETASVYCDQIKNCQGILPLNGEVYAVADGPDGAALYRLVDTDGDGRADEVRALVGFANGIAEHGPHGLALGPDGLIYVMIGNHSAAKRLTTSEDDKDAAADVTATFAASSPYQNWYEGDLLEPKYEDANGHAVGIKAPCGTIVRTDADGSFLQLYAGGFRNAYDIAFNRDGELLTHDSDMEWDAGLPWYRPTRVYHVPPGGEFGSRSGWSPWPTYWLDGLPAIAETDRGSPTGVEVYNHNNYPAAYQNALFVGDWSHGRILAVRMKPNGASYSTELDVFLEGRPLNVTDLAVGPDGWLYFCTGGRGTEGGVYRVVYTGQIPTPPKLSPIQQALRQPQPQSAWGRQKIAVLQEKMGAEWGRQLLATVSETSNRADDRVRALEMMQLYGPPADAKLLARLARDTQPGVRAKAAFLMGTQPADSLATPLGVLLRDSDALVRRNACEAITRGKYDAISAEALVPVLADRNRLVAFAAARALQRLPREEWQAAVLEAPALRSFLVGATALVALDVDRDTCLTILERCRTTMAGFVGDDDFLDLLRVVQLTLKRGKLTGDDVPDLRTALADEYPSGEPRMNRELLRLVAYLQAGDVLPRLLDELHGKAPDVEKIHTALCARFFTTGWTTPAKLELLAYYEEARELPGGHSFKGYIENVARDFAKQLNGAERQAVLAEAERWPSAALAVLATLESVPPELVTQLIDLDKRLLSNEAEAARRLQTGIIAMLAASGTAEGMVHLREAFETQPERRPDLAMGLAQQPDGDNWPLLIRSLAAIDGGAGQEVLTQLLSAKQTSTNPRDIRQVILSGLRLKDEGGQQAVKLLNQWAGEEITAPDLAWDKALEQWQTWFEENYPDQPPAVLPVEAEGSKYSFQELLSHFDTDEARHAEPAHGKAIFEKANCAKCHRFAGRGESIGPDLSTVSQRFQKKEILEAIVFPSLVISDQYAAKTITTTSGKVYTGIVGASGADAVIVLQANGQKVTVRRDDIEQTEPSRKSAMPEGLLDKLTLEEIADLFAYLAQQPSQLTRKPK